MDARLERMADVLVEYSLRVEGGDVVLVSGPVGRIRIRSSAA